MSPDHQAILEQIENEQRAQFDQQSIFALREINANQKKVLSQKHSESANPDVRAFAARKLGLIRSLKQSLGDVGKRLLPVEVS